MIDFYRYLESKILFFENNVDYFYDFKTKKFYPIINNSVYVDSEKIEIEKKGLLPKIKNSPEYLIKSDVIKNNIFKILTKNNNPSQELTDQKDAQYIEINNIYFPIIKKGQEVGYTDGKGNYIKLTDDDLKLYKISKKRFYNYYVNLKSSKKISSSNIDSELNELETSEETPAEPEGEEEKK